jgi:hypothetical protein
VELFHNLQQGAQVAQRQVQVILADQDLVAVLLQQQVVRARQDKVMLVAQDLHPILILAAAAVAVQVQ